MNKAFSLYLDAVRFIAAGLVYMYHSNQRWLVKDPLPLSNYGHSSVIVFFVLSGFVIAYITERKENHWASYTASRLSRVYSVVLPALLLTLVLDGVGRMLQPAIYGYPFDHFLIRTVGSLFMLNEWWLVSITAFSNVPFWSITYEFWYYAAFGAWAFLPRKWGFFVSFLILLAVGPKLMLLAPIWLAGVLLFRWKFPYRMSLLFAGAVSLLSALLIVLVHTEGVLEAAVDIFKNASGDEKFRLLTFSKFFMGDYILCVLVFMHFVGMRRVLAEVQADISVLEKPIRWVAGYTFTLYLLHQPLFLFWGSVLGGDADGIFSWAFVTVLTALSVIVVGHWTEQKRYPLKAFLERHLRRWASRVGSGEAFASQK